MIKFAIARAQLAKFVFLGGAIVIPIIASAQPSAPQPSAAHIEYHVTEYVRTPKDHRIHTTTISLGTTGNAGYRYTEQVLGAITSQVRSVNYATVHHQRIATATEQANLVRALLKAKVFDLVSDPKEVQSSDYFGSLNIQISGRKSQVFFYRPPRSHQRKALHQIMRRFAKQLGINKRPANATTITEGDQQPARKVSLADVIAHPNRYHGKRISVVGFYHGEEESSTLSVDEATPRALALKTKEWRSSGGGQAGFACVAPLYKSLYKSSVWRSESSTFANKAAISHKNDAWVHVEGVFLRGPAGHLGLWPGQIVRVTRIAPVPRPR